MSESLIDQLNTKVAITEAQLATATSQLNTVELELVASRGKVLELEQKLAWAQEARDYNGKKLDEIRSYIQASIDNGDWSDEELDEIFWEELADKLDLEIMKAVEVVIKAEWTATVKMKRTQDLGDLDISVSEPEGSYGVQLEDVWERSFTIDEA